MTCKPCEANAVKRYRNYYKQTMSLRLEIESRLTFLAPSVIPYMNDVVNELKNKERELLITTLRAANRAQIGDDLYSTMNKASLSGDLAELRARMPGVDMVDLLGLPARENG